jgi:hypothetical protein
MDIAERTVELLLGKKPRDPNRKERFEQAYALKETQLLKRVPPPFLPERARFLAATLPSRSMMMEATLVFNYDGNLRLGRITGQNSIGLKEAFTLVVGLKPFEIDVPKDLLAMRISGDWVRRKDADTTFLILELEKILRSQVKLPLRFEGREVVREVIVASGLFAPPPNASVWNDQTVHFYTGAQPPPPGFPGTFASVGELLNDLQDIIHLRIAHEAQEPAKINLKWANHLLRDVREIEENNAAGAEKLKSLLENLNKETGLRFRPSFIPCQDNLSCRPVMWWTT